MKREFQGVAIQEMEAITDLIGRGLQFLEALHMTGTKLKHTLEETRRVKDSTRRGDVNLDWQTVLGELSKLDNQMIYEACLDCELVRFDLGKLTLSAPDSAWSALNLMKGLFIDWLTEQYGVPFKVRIQRKDDY